MSYLEAHENITENRKLSNNKNVMNVYIYTVFA